MKASRLLLGFALAFAMSATSRANLITNGDFSAGLASWSTQYTLFPPNGQGSYLFTTTPNTANSNWTNPTSVVPGPNNSTPVPVPGTSNLAVFDGAASSATQVLQQTISGLVNGTTYNFAGYLATLFAQNPATLSVTLGGQTIATVPAPSGTGTLNGFQSTFVYTGATGSASLVIVDTNTTAIGNDFALSNLGLNVVPEPASVVLFGAGLAGFGLVSVRRYRRRHSA